MSMPSSEQRIPRFCGQCGVALPENSPRFCIACGRPVRGAPAAEPHGRVADGPTVLLPNARGEQSVVGGTIKLPTAGAIPPGLWLLPEVPGPDDVIAIYAPLHAVVGGWSATTSDGWHKLGQVWAADDTSRELVRFEIEREWFAAAGCAQNTRLHIRISATSFADEGRTRRGFRYRIGADPPMEVVEAWWADATLRRRAELPVPQIQIMAPPRARRISDYDEPISQMSEREAELWARAGAIHQLYRMPDGAQQRTPAGRGIPLFELTARDALLRLTGRLDRTYRVQLLAPLVCPPGAWEQLQPRIQRDARALGLDMQSDAVVEWWLDRQGHDGVVFEQGAHPHGRGRMAVAFRRAQIAEIVPS